MIIGVLNVTPDSFSDGGMHCELDKAVEFGRSMINEGADVVDVGGESTRPGAVRVSQEEEERRVLPVVRELVAQGVVVSIDTMRSSVAEQAVDAGVTYVNDVSGCLADPRMVEVLAASGTRVIIQHWRAHSDVMLEPRYTQYQDVVQDVRNRLLERVAVLQEAGVARERVIIDPGIGFSKLPDHNWTILARAEEFVDAGLPVLMGPSRKKFLTLALRGDRTGESAGTRDAATIVTTLRCADAGVWGVRVHDVKSTRDALDVWDHLRRVRRLPYVGP